MRKKCDYGPWIFEGEPVKCDCCGREMCRGEWWTVEEHGGREMLLCWSCVWRGFEVSMQKQLTLEYKDGTIITFIDPEYDIKEIWK